MPLTSLAAVVAVALAASSALVGWASGWAFLASSGFGAVAMNPLTAITLLLAAVSLVLRLPAGDGSPRDTAGICVAAVIVAIGALVLLDYATGVVAIDRILFRSRLDTLTTYANRMAPNTAAAFVLAGTAIGVLHVETRKGRHPAQRLAVLLLLLVLFTLTGHAYGATLMTRIGAYIPMAVNTALAFGALGVGILGAHADRGLAAIVMRRDPVGTAARGLLTVAVCLPWGLGWCNVVAEHAGVWGSAFGTALLVVAMIALLATATWWTAYWLGVAAEAHARAEQEAIEGARRLRAINVMLDVLAASPAGRVPHELAEAARTAFSSRWAGCWYLDESGRFVGASASADGVAAEDSVDAWGDVAPAAWPDPWQSMLRDGRAIVLDPPAAVPGVPADLPHALAGPIVYQGTFVGLFVVANHRESYAELDRELLASMCHAIAPATGARLERHRNESALRDVNEKLATSNRELEAFSYSVAHDLRAPLRAVDGFARILHEDYGPGLDAEGLRLLGVVSENAQRMGHLIDDLLALSRLGRRDLDDSVVDPVAVVEGVVATLRQADPERTVTVRVGAFPRVRCDRGMLRQALANLVGNAWKFTGRRPRATIEVASAIDGDELVCWVRDDGVGFDMQHAENLFGVFQRLHRASDFEGTGVGLATVRRILERHGGRVWADSRPDEGATFYFALPRTRICEEASDADIEHRAAADRG